MGWVAEDLQNPKTDINQLEFFGFLRCPSKRHTMGVVEYLHQTQQLELLYNEQVNHLLVSAVFDQHSYTITQMLPAELVARTTFFIIDQDYYHYEILVKNYLNTHGVELPLPVARITHNNAGLKSARIKLDQLKQQYSVDHARLQKNFLGWDIQLYNHHLQRQSIWHKWGDPPETGGLPQPVN